MKQFLLLSFLLFISAAAFPSGARQWQVYFTEPEGSRCPVVERLCGFINAAEKSIDAALYDLDEKKVIKALARAANRGVTVRLVMESDNYRTTDLSVLKKAINSVVHDRKRGLMHDKFFIFDRALLWTGSLNVTKNGTRRNNNNVIVLPSPDLAAEYTEEFEEMYCGRIFGNRKDSRAFPWFYSPRRFQVGSLHVTPLFAPEDDIEGELVKKIRRAEKSILFMAFSFTSNTLGEELVKKKSEGVEVRGIIEKRGSRTAYSEYIKLLVEGIDVRRDSNPGMMHHKVFIIDGSLLVTGSYNFSKGAAEKNDENILFVEGEKVAQLYRREFERLFARSQPFRRKR